MVTIRYFNDLVLDDVWFESQTPAQLKAWLEDWCRVNLGRYETVWVCPLLDGHIVFGDIEPDWRAAHGG